MSVHQAILDTSVKKLVRRGHGGKGATKSAPVMARTVITLLVNVPVQLAPSVMTTVLQVFTGHHVSFLAECHVKVIDVTKLTDIAFVPRACSARNATRNAPLLTMERTAGTCANVHAQILTAATRRQGNAFVKVDSTVHSASGAVQLAFMGDLVSTNVNVKVVCCAMLSQENARKDASLDIQENHVRLLVHRAHMAMTVHANANARRDCRRCVITSQAHALVCQASSG